MSAPQSLLQAAVHRLMARLGSGLADAAAELAVRAQEAPARLQQEWTLFWEEVEQEAERLERGEASPQATAAAGQAAAGPDVSGPAASGSRLDPQDQIDALRARVAALGRRLDGVEGVAG